VVEAEEPANGRSLDGSLAKRQLLSHVLTTDDFQGVREREEGGRCITAEGGCCFQKKLEREGE
jgi:hypothetical protein